MPRSTREWAHRKLDEASNCLDWTGKHLYDISERYKEQHPEISDPLNEYLQIISDLIEQIKDFKKYI